MFIWLAATANSPFPSHDFPNHVPLYPLRLAEEPLMQNPVIPVHLQFRVCSFKLRLRAMILIWYNMISWVCSLLVP